MAVWINRYYAFRTSDFVVSLVELTVIVIASFI